MESPVIFYVPMLQRQHARVQHPEFLAFITAGLPEPRPQGCGTSPAVPPSVRDKEASFRNSLPLSPAEARAVLEELLRLGNEHGATGLLRQLAAHDALEKNAASVTAVFATDEQEALDAFRSTGEVPAQEAPLSTQENTRQMLIESQKILLLAHALEQIHEDVMSLTGLLGSSKASLHAFLQDDMPGEEALVDAAIFSATPQEPAEPENAADIPWRSIVEASLAFLPEPAILLTAEPSLVRDVAEYAAPVPDEKRGMCAHLLGVLPELMAEHLLYVSMPGWQLVGKRKPVATKPWLDRNVTLFLVKEGTPLSKNMPTYVV